MSTQTETTTIRSAVDKKFLSQYVLPLDQPVVKLDCDLAFNALNEKEKLYAHYLCQASWYGGLTAVVQVS
jgi:dipeptidyl-peptidase-3